ncbi:MAG: elongation factor G, partial [Synergistales bacterium]|nr:elongation factor G [Synergistales bacterium]
LKATLVDGSYHDVDSNELSFKMAARLAYKAGIPKANPAILEPVGHLKVFVPDSYMGDVIGDLNSRRCVIQELTNRGHLKVIHGLVPLSEMFGYATDLRSKTSGRATYSMQFHHYEPVSADIAEKVLKG